MQAAADALAWAIANPAKFMGGWMAVSIITAIPLCRHFKRMAEQYFSEDRDWNQ